MTNIKRPQRVLAMAAIAITAVVAQLLVLTPAVAAQVPVGPNGPELTTVVSCLAGNGRVDTTIVNTGTTSTVYRLELQGLSPREVTVVPGDWARMPITGRPDRDYTYVVKRGGVGGTVIADQTLNVSCDSAPPVLTGEPVSIVSSCRAGNGFILLQFVNPTDAPKSYVITFDGVQNRSTTAAAFGASVRAITGRPDGAYNMAVRTAGVITYEATVTVDCDGEPPALPTPNSGFDYQIGQDYPLPQGVSTVSRDWFSGQPAAGAYSICYVNAFQTQPDEDFADRPDETSNWPADLILTDLADDPNWTGEYLVDISTAAKRSQAAAHVQQMVATCAEKGFDAVEYDNLDSWTRFENIPSLDAQVPFGQAEAVLYAALLSSDAHTFGMAAAQKNTTQIISSGQRVATGFDFAIAEECGTYDECQVFVNGYGDNVLVIEYTVSGFNKACSEFASTLSIIRRDVFVTAPGSATYVYDAC